MFSIPVPDSTNSSNFYFNVKDDKYSREYLEFIMTNNCRQVLEVCVKEDGHSREDRETIINTLLGLMSTLPKYDPTVLAKDEMILTKCMKLIKMLESNKIKDVKGMLSKTVKEVVKIVESSSAFENKLMDADVAVTLNANNMKEERIIFSQQEINEGEMESLREIDANIFIYLYMLDKQEFPVNVKANMYGSPMRMNIDRNSRFNKKEFYSKKFFGFGAPVPPEYEDYSYTLKLSTILDHKECFFIVAQYHKGSKSWRAQFVRDGKSIHESLMSSMKVKILDSGKWKSIPTRSTEDKPTKNRKSKPLAEKVKPAIAENLSTSCESGESSVNKDDLRFKDEKFQETEDSKDENCKLAKHLCWNCAKSSKEVELFKCKGCKKARYCGLGCQNEDWNRHGEYCVNKQLKKASVSS